MRINTHAHIYNLASVFTEQTLRTLLQRLRREEIPDFLITEVNDVVTEAIRRSGQVDTDALLRKWLARLARKADVQRFVEDLDPVERQQLRLLNADGLAGLGIAALSNVLHAVREGRFDAEGDARRKGVSDYLEFLYIGLQPDLKHVTHRLMAQQDDDGAIVALTMDVTRGGDADRAFFLRQLDKTSRQVLAYPGRIFPFVFVNPNRTGHFEIMERALNAQGFVGVKLYPSLGYAIDSPEMRRVYGYCQERGIPLMQHCNQGGFYFNQASVRQANPAHWRAVLDDFPALKICFAHLGGIENMIQPTIPPDSWSATIFDLMDSFEGVYTDFSYCVDPMDGGESEANYLRHMKGFLQDPVRKHRLLFGTDYFLVRMRLRESSFWQYYENRLTAEEQRLVMEVNPAAYLGLPAGAEVPNTAMRNYVRFVGEHSREVEAEPVPWLREAVAAEFGPGLTFDVTAFGPRWSRNNRVHRTLYAYLEDRQMSNLPENRQTFEAAGAVRVQDLDFWNKEFESLELFERKRDALARRLDRAFRRAGARYEQGYNGKRARKNFRDALNDGMLRLVELGAVSDQIYRFQEEDR